MLGEAVSSNDAKVLYDFLRHSTAVCIDLASDLRYDGSHKWHVNLVILYGSILELSHSIQVLLDGESSVGVSVLLRSMLEASVDIRNLEVERTYGYYMDAAYLKQWIKVFDEAKKGDNPYLNGMAESPKFDDTLLEYQVRLKELEEQGYKALSIFDKFSKSGQVKEYRSIYNFLCSDSHNNQRSLVLRHITSDRGNAEREIQFFSPFKLDFCIQEIVLCIEILIDSTVIIHKALNSIRLPDVKLLAVKFSEIC